MGMVDDTTSLVFVCGCASVGGASWHIDAYWVVELFTFVVVVVLLVVVLIVVAFVVVLDVNNVVLVSLVVVL